jgi:hypothetical protein
MSAMEGMIGAACNLSEDDLRRRVAEWNGLRRRAAAVTRVVGGVSLELRTDESLSAVADLAAREAACCPFYTFVIRIDGPARQLDISAGPGGEPAVSALLGL